MSIERINLIGVPIDICEPENLESEILELLAKPGTKQIVFLSIWDLLKARRKNDFSECVKNADLVIPISKSILKGAKFLKKPIPVRYNPFSAVIQILGILDSHYKSLYMFGSHKKTLVRAEKNVHATFPGLRIVGRYVGYYPKQVEDNIIQAIFKSQPSLVLLSEGIREKNIWPYRRRNRFSSSIFFILSILSVFRSLSCSSRNPLPIRPLFPKTPVLCPIFISFPTKAFSLRRENRQRAASST